MRICQEGKVARAKEMGLLRDSKQSGLTTAKGAMTDKVGELVRLGSVEGSEFRIRNLNFIP